MSDLTSTELDELATLVRGRHEDLQKFLDLQRGVDLDALDLLKADPKVLLGELESSEYSRVKAAAVALWDQKEKAVPHLTEFLGQSDNPRARVVARHLLSRLDSGYQARLLSRLMDGAGPEESARLMKALMDSGVSWQKAMTVLLHHPASDVRRAVGRLVAGGPLPPNEKLSILMQGVSGDDVGASVDAQRAMGAVGGDDAVTYLAAFLKKGLSWGKTPSDVDIVHREVCLALGNTGSQNAVPVLLGMLSTGLAGKLLGGGSSSAVKAAALWGLAHLGGDKAAQAIKKAASDSDAAVKAVANLLIDQMNKPSSETVSPSGDFTDEEFQSLFTSPA